MRNHPIPPVTESLQYRAIGIVRGIYCPTDEKQFTRGRLIDEKGEGIEAVVLGRVITLMRRHLAMDQPHLWVVYPRCRQANFLHLQIAGIWEPSTLGSNSEGKLASDDSLQEGDDYFSVRGELIYTRPETSDLVVKIRQQSRPQGSHSLPFKLKLKGDIPLEQLRKFVSLNVRRCGQELHLENYEIIGSILRRGGRGGSAG